jgi:hypothetical protein
MFIFIDEGTLLRLGRFPALVRTLQQHWVALEDWARPQMWAESHRRLWVHTLIGRLLWWTTKNEKVMKELNMLFVWGPT